MRVPSTPKIVALCSMLVCLLLASPCVQSGAHTWVINELFSNADGTVQFVELFELNGVPNELGVNGLDLKSVFHSTHTITPADRSSPFSAPGATRTRVMPTSGFAPRTSNGACGRQGGFRWSSR